MAKATVRIFLFAFLVLLPLWILQFIVDKGLRKSKMQNYAVWNDVYQSRVNADVIINGGSRAKLVLSPKIIDSVLHTNSYNLGINGGYFPIQDAMFKVYLQHNKKPKYIIQNVDFVLFTNGPHLSNSDQYIPYINDTIVRNMADHYEERFTLAELYFPSFKYNNHFNLIKEGVYCYFNTGKRAANGLYKGYGATNTDFDDFFSKRIKNEADYLRNNIDKHLDAEFAAYLDFCKANGIQVIFVYGPVLQELMPLVTPDTSAITRRIIYYSRLYHIPYLSYTTDSLCYHKELFADHIHMNAAGAKLYNEKLANDLKGIIK